MPPAKKSTKAFQTDWDWAFEVDRMLNDQQLEQFQLQRGYNLIAGRCEPLKCKKNCRHNPFCLNGLGMEKWEQFCDQKKNQLAEPEEELKKGTFPGGLRNLGATCYVNSYLQLWYHNIPFRRAIYEWQPGLKFHRKAEILQQLQRIFAFMQSSPRQFVDPKNFIDSLGIDSGEQQDAQEFGKLFMAIVEEVMHGSSRIVDDLFKGSYAYVTRCLECQNQSETISTFTELDLQIAGMKFLQDCLTSYFKPEILDGDNQYFCQLCQRKVKATRQIQLKRLPPVLNIQLMRFIYDRSTGQKKKLSNIVQFPELLDLSEYLGLPRDQYVYELSAVLIHHGVSANSGHYYALIRENNTRRWFQYNDEKVTLQTGKVLKTELDKEAEQEFTSTPTTKKPRIEAGMQGSRGAYMLVYQLVKEGDGEIDAESPKLPADLETEVKETFAAIDCANEQLKAENTKIIAHVQQKREAVEKVFKELFVTADTELSQIDFVPKKTLETFLNPANSEKSSGGFLEPVDMKLFLCSHGKLDFRQLVSYKCVKRTGAQHLYDLFICDQPMTYADLCLSCVKYKCATLQLQKKAKSDAARITNLVKNFRADQVCEGFWVGKESLKNWKKMAERNLAQDYGVQITNGARSTEPAEDADVTIGEPSISPDLVENTDKKISETTEEPGENGSTENDVGDLRFNTDLLCCHGGFSTEEDKRKLIPTEAWQILTKYFENSAVAVPQFYFAAETCSQCEAQKFDQFAKADQLKSAASSWKTDLHELIAKKNRPNWANQDEIYLLCEKFHTKVVDFVKDPLKKPPQKDVCNKCLLCKEHENLVINGATALEDDNSAKLFVPVWPAEWLLLSKKANVDFSIRLLRISSGVESEPAFCSDCSAQFYSDLLSEEFDYNYSRIVVCQISEKDIIPVTAVCRNETDLNQVQNELRRSTRQPKPRGGRTMEVSSETTITEIKLQLMPIFNAAPIDQHLYYNGLELSEGKSTLKSLRIPPNSLFYLQIDKPVPFSEMQVETFTSPPKMEKGFLGSHLVG